MEEDEDEEGDERTNCDVCLSGCKQVATFTLSHIGLLTLVVLYCVAGAAIFEVLESGNELAVKRNMTYLRLNVSEDLWKMTEGLSYIRTEEWSAEALKILEKYEGELLTAYKEKGWDGEEEQVVRHWTYLGSLFYSIIVITTIGYGHIAPKTMWGRIVTIFYAIIGIPLMVVCLSHIGGFMANAFKFLYWKVCCFICTRNPRPRHRAPIRARNRSVRGPSSRTSGSIRMKSRSIKRHTRASQRSADSAASDSVISVASDPGVYRSRTLRQHSSTLPRTTQPRPVPHPSRGAQRSTKSAEPEPSTALSLQNIRNTPVLFNRYAEDLPPKNRTSKSQPLEKFYEDDIEEEEMMPTSRISRNRNRAPPPEENFPHLEDEGGGYWDDDREEDEEYYEEYESVPHHRRQVPIWLCSFLVLGYIIGGAFLFSSWEEWEFLDSFYFCFITLTTIGFGDFVPAQKFKTDSEVKGIAFCSLYLLFGIALLAMSFNLVQEQVINAFKDLAIRLGILPEEEER